MKNKRPIIIGLICVAIILSIAFAVCSFVKEIQRPKLPFYGQIRDFTLSDSNGKDFQLKKLKGKVWMANFIFTTCGDICPIMTKNMASLHRSFELLDDVAMVSFTVNPEFDTPKVLNKYAKKI